MEKIVGEGVDRIVVGVGRGGKGSGKGADGAVIAWYAESEKGRWCGCWQGRNRQSLTSVVQNALQVLEFVNSAFSPAQVMLSELSSSQVFYPVDEGQITPINITVCG